MSVGIIRNLGGGKSEPQYQECVSVYRMDRFVGVLINLTTGLVTGGREYESPIGWDRISNNSNLFRVTYSTSTRQFSIYAKTKIHCAWGDTQTAGQTVSMTERDYNAGELILRKTDDYASNANLIGTYMAYAL